MDNFPKLSNKDTVTNTEQTTGRSAIQRITDYLLKNRTELIILSGFFTVSLLGLLILHLIQPLGWRIEYFWMKFDKVGILTVLSLVVGVFLLEIIVLGWKKSSLYKLIFQFDLSAKNDLFVSLIYYLGLGAVFAGFFSFGSSKFIPDLLHEVIGTNLLQIIPSYWIQFLVYLIIADFAGYWYHRIMHEIQFLWEVHKYHHSATDFLVITGGREHPLEHAFQRIFQALPLALLGAYAFDYLLLLIIFRLQAILAHSMLNWNFGWIGRWIVYSPVDHRIHHSKRYEHWDKNFGSFFVFWDRMFGTFYTGSNLNKEVGLSENSFNQRTVIYDLYRPLKMGGRALANSLRSGRWLAEHRRKENIEKYREM